MPLGVTAALPWPFELLRRFWGARDSLAVILREIKGKWSSVKQQCKIETSPPPNTVLPQAALKNMPISPEGSGGALAEGRQLPGLPTAPPWAGEVPVPGPRGKGAEGWQQLLQVRTEGSRSS